MINPRGPSFGHHSAECHETWSTSAVPNFHDDVNGRHDHTHPSCDNPCHMCANERNCVDELFRAPAQVSKVTKPRTAHLDQWSSLIE